MPKFTPGRNQDAAATIRGFKYQVQLTIMRWLELDENEVLYLECGEDVDRVLKATDSSEVQRELEQIKIRGRNITLRSTDVLTSLANFAGHIRSNPHAQLCFRFTTTAVTGREKITPFTGGEHAIDVWQMLQKKQAWTLDDTKSCDLLSQLIAGSSRPQKCTEKSWDALIGIAGGSGELSFQIFVSKFEWSCGLASPEEFDVIIKDQLGKLSNGTELDGTVLDQRYWQLFFEVYNLLTRAGEKTLTKELLGIALNKPTLGESDRKRLGIFEERMDSHSDQLEALRVGMEQLTSKEALPIYFGDAINELSSIEFKRGLKSVPPQVKKLARRGSTSKGLARRLGLSNWMWIHGDYGTGKSHLSYLISEQCGGIVLGVSMRGLSAESAERGLQELMSDSSWASLMQSGSQGVVLLDDLPQCKPQGKLESLLISFASTVLSSGRSIVSSSRQRESTSMRAMIGSQLITQACPPFEVSDADELFRMYEIDDGFLSTQRVFTMNAMCRGHPLLLTALAQYIVAFPGEPEKALVDAFEAGKHREQIDLEISQVVLGSVDSENCRNLLYRLALAGISMSQDEIRSLAAVSPSLPEPTGCISRLDGLWLRRATETRYEVSPLAIPLASEVPPQDKLLIYSQVASIVFSRKQVSTTDFQKAIASLIAAGQQTSAAMHLVLGCNRWPNKAKGYFDLGVLNFFPLGNDHGLSISTEMAIRGVQAITVAIEDEDYQPYINRVDYLLSGSSSEVVMGSIFFGSLIMTSSFEIPIELAIFGASLIERYFDSTALEDHIELAATGQVKGSHLWILIALVHSWDDIDKYLDFISSIPEDRRFEVCSSSEMKEGMRLMLFRTLFDENGELTPGAYERLVKLEDRGVELGIDLLAVYAASGRLVIHGEYEKDIDRALDEADICRKRYGSNTVALSIIEVMVGQQLCLNGRIAEGLNHLAIGLHDPTHIIGLERANRLVEALSAAWDIHGDVGLYADELSSMLLGNEFVVPEVYCQMHAQVAVVRWRQNNKEDAFKHLELSIINFFELDDGVRTRQLGASLAHTMSYCTSIAECGKPPNENMIGEPYVEGNPHMFSGAKEGIAELWRAVQGPAVLRWMLSRLAEALGTDDAASVWAERAQKAALESKSPVLLCLLAPRTIISFLKESDWLGAMDTAIICGRAHVLLDTIRFEEADSLDDSVRFEPDEIPSSREQQLRAEEYSINLLSLTIGNEFCSKVGSKGEDMEQLVQLAEVISRNTQKMQLRYSWDALVKIVRLSVSEEMTNREYRESLTETQEQGSGDARALAHCLLSLRVDAQIGQAAVSQVGTLFRFDQVAESMDLSKDRYAQEVCCYWAEAIVRSPFMFRLPKGVEKSIVEAQDKTILLQAKFILRAVCQSLAVTIDSPVRKWLDA